MSDKSPDQPGDAQAPQVDQDPSQGGVANPPASDPHAFGAPAPSAHAAAAEASSGPPPSAPFGYGATPPAYDPSQQPYGQPTQAYGQAGTPAPAQFGATPPGQPGGGKPKTGLWIGLGAAAMVLVLVTVLAVVLLTGNRDDEADESTANPTDTPSASVDPAAYDAPEAAVEAYFDALIAGDSNTALSLVFPAPDDYSLLTDEMLTASADVAPISDVVVEAPQNPDGSISDIRVTYQVGDSTAQTSIAVTNRDDSWMVRGYATLRAPNRSEGLDITLNGFAIEDPDDMVVFPGAYEIGTSTTYFTFTGTTQVLVGTDYSYDFDDAEPTLDEEGLTIFQEAIRADVEECIASTQLAGGCGLDISSQASGDLVPIEGTVSRTLSADAQASLSNLEPDLAYDNPFAVSVDSWIGRVETTLQCEDTSNGTTGPCTSYSGNSLEDPVVDFNQDPVTVHW
ncbi:MAG: hypothetical protein ACK5KU_12275 [Beutenbergiaceae bacterium]